MPHEPIRTTVIGSYPFPGWLELCGLHPGELGPDDLDEAVRDAVTAAVSDQVRAGLDVITDGEQARFDFNLSFYAHLEGLELEERPRRRFGPPAHDQRGRSRHRRGARCPARPRCLSRTSSGSVSSHPPGPVLKARSRPVHARGSHRPVGRIPRSVGGGRGTRRPGLQAELVRLVAAGCSVVTVDEPSMSCYAYREDTARLVDLFNRTVEPIVGRCYLGTHLCFGNYKGRAASKRRYAPMFPAFLGLAVDELHLEMASREFSELELIAAIGAEKDVAVGVIDVKSTYLETPEDVEERIRACLEHVPAERLAVAPDCGLSQTARWAARAKLESMVEGARRVRAGL